MVNWACGGTGLRVALKMLWEQSRVGSSPTMPIKYMFKPKSTTKSFQWTPDLSYIVGLLTTDGCLSNDRRHIIMRSSDIQLLETFKKCLKINNKIGITQNGNIRSYRVQYGDVQFYNWLLGIGLYPAKTYTLGKIFIPPRYFRDFLRGHLDGDGSIITYQDNYNSYKGKKIFKHVHIH